jgi:hypothetical protein
VTTYITGGYAIPGGRRRNPSIERSADWTAERTR